MSVKYVKGKYGGVHAVGPSDVMASSKQNKDGPVYFQTLQSKHHHLKQIGVGCNTSPINNALQKYLLQQQT